MKSSKGKAKDQKPKTQFHVVPPNVAHNNAPGTSMHAGHPVAPHFVRQVTPSPYVTKPGPSPRYAGHPNKGGSNDKHQTSTYAGASNKSAGQDKHAMPPPPRKVHRPETESDIWVRIKTVVSEDPTEEPTASINATKLEHQRNQGKFAGRRPDFKRLLEYKGRDLSLTDLLPPTLGNGTLGVLERYSATGGVMTDSSSSVTAHQFRRVQPAVQNGLMFIPTKTRPRPEANSFAESTDLRPTQVRKKWTVDLGNYFDDEVTFTLEGLTLTIEGKQTSRAGQARTTTESIELPTAFDVDQIRVYRNHQMGALIIAYEPTPSS